MGSLVMTLIQMQTTDPIAVLEKRNSSSFPSFKIELKFIALLPSVHPSKEKRSVCFVIKPSNF